VSRCNRQHSFFFFCFFLSLSLSFFSLFFSSRCKKSTMVSSRVLLYGESYALRFQTTTTASTLPFVGAAPPHSAPVTVNFSCNATDLPVLARCGEFLVHHGPSYCVLESSKMTLEQLRDVLASGELFHVAAGEAVWNALLAADDGAEDAGDVDDEDGYNDDNDSRTVADVTGLLLVAGVFVQGDGSVVSDLITQRQRSDAATNLRMLASRATAALAAVARVQAPLLAVGVAAQVLAFRESLVVALQVPPVVGAREVLLLWGVRWAPGQLRAAVDERAGAGIERAGGSSGASRVSSALAQVRVLQFSPTAVFDDADNDALLALCLDALPCLQALCLKGASGITVATIQRLLTEHKALRFVCVVGAKRPSILRASWPR
jgi:hypothetical protein